MLTALSVARDCHMIEASGKVILVQCLPPKQQSNTTVTSLGGDPSGVTSSRPELQFSYAEDESQQVVEVTSQSLLKGASAGGGGGGRGATLVEIDDAERVHFAMTGKSWSLVRQHFADVIPKLVVRGTVFARFSPEQKQQLIEALQDVG